MVEIFLSFTVFLAVFTLIEHFRQFLYSKDIWRALKKLCTNFFSGFRDNRLMLKSAALSYTTVLCLIPLLAITFTISSFFLAKQSPQRTNRVIDNLIIRMVPQIELLERFRGQLPKEDRLPSRKEIRDKIKSMINSIGSGQVGVIGTIALILFATSLLLTIEHAFDDIWNVQQDRPLLKWVFIYWIAVVFGLSFFLLSMSYLPFWETTFLIQLLEKIPYMTRFLGFMTSFIFVTGGLVVVYLLMPNTRVDYRAGILGGIFGGTLLQLNYYLNSLYVINILSTQKFYGAIGIVPLLLVGLFSSWLIVLCGAQMARSIENLTSPQTNTLSRKT